MNNKSTTTEPQPRMSAVRFKAEVLLLLLPLFVGVLCFVLVLLFSTLDPYGFAIIVMGKRESWLLYFYCLPDVL